MSGVRQNGFLDETLKMLGLSVLSGAVVGGLILSFLPRREQQLTRRETSRNVNIFFFSLYLSIYQLSSYNTHIYTYYLFLSLSLTHTHTQAQIFSYNTHTHTHKYTMYISLSSLSISLSHSYNTHTHTYIHT